MRRATVILWSGECRVNVECLTLWLYSTVYAEDGFCDDGCFRFGTQHVELGVFLGLDNDGLPFKVRSMLGLTALWNCLVTTPVLVT